MGRAISERLFLFLFFLPPQSLRTMLPVVRRQMNRLLMTHSPHQKDREKERRKVKLKRKAKLKGKAEVPNQRSRLLLLQMTRRKR